MKQTAAYSAAVIDVSFDLLNSPLLSIGVRIGHVVLQESHRWFGLRAQVGYSELLHSNVISVSRGVAFLGSPRRLRRQHTCASLKAFLASV